MRTCTLALLVLVPLANAQPAAGHQWFSAWTAAPSYVKTTTMSGTSVRMIVRPTISGTAVRVQLQNIFGQVPVVFAAAYIGLVQSGAALAPGSNTQIAFNGNAGLTLAPGGSAYSDPLSFPIAAFSRYAISLDVTTATVVSGHGLGLVTNYMAIGAHSADATASSFTPIPDNNTDSTQGPTFPSYWVSSVDVESSSNTGTVVTLGDSITDGVCSTRTNNGAFSGTPVPDLYNRWTDVLAMRFAALPASQAKAVADEGISGNTVISPLLAGPPAVDRLSRDVLAREGATHVILLEGTNDIGSEGQTSAAIIAGDQQIIDQAHAAGLKIIGATLLPRGGEGAWTTFQEQQRVALNTWIRTQAKFDGLIDFDKLMQGSVGVTTGAPAIPPKWGCWDGVHPNSAGYAAMAAFIDLTLFSAPTSTAVISGVSNAEGGSATIAPNTWVAIQGTGLAPSGDIRIWQTPDFMNNQMPTNLDGVSATVNGVSAYIYYISPTQINLLTPPAAISGPVQVVVDNNGAVTAPFSAQAQTISPSFFVFPGSYIAATHLDGSLIGPSTLYPGSSTPAKPGETVVMYANGFGPTSKPVLAGSVAQSGTLSPMPAIKIGGANATVLSASLVAPGEYQFNVTVPASLPDGDQPIAATYNGLTTQPGTLLAILH
jgi:uncharacterized protein (TIGR03437 family)